MLCASTPGAAGGRTGLSAMECCLRRAQVRCPRACARSPATPLAAPARSACEWELARRFPMQPDSAQAAARRRFKDRARVSPDPAARVRARASDRGTASTRATLPAGQPRCTQCWNESSVPLAASWHHHHACVLVWAPCCALTPTHHCRTTAAPPPPRPGAPARQVLLCQCDFHAALLHCSLEVVACASRPVMSAAMRPPSAAQRGRQPAQAAAAVRCLQPPCAWWRRQLHMCTRTCSRARPPRRATRPGTTPR